MCACVIDLTFCYCLNHLLAALGQFCRSSLQMGKPLQLGLVHAHTHTHVDTYQRHTLIFKSTIHSLATTYTLLLHGHTITSLYNATLLCTSRTMYAATVYAST